MAKLTLLLTLFLLVAWIVVAAGAPLYEVHQKGHCFCTMEYMRRAGHAHTRTHAHTHTHTHTHAHIHTASRFVGRKFCRLRQPRKSPINKGHVMRRQREAQACHIFWQIGWPWKQGRGDWRGGVCRLGGISNKGERVVRVGVD